MVESYCRQIRLYLNLKPERVFKKVFHECVDKGGDEIPRTGVDEHVQEFSEDVGQLDNVKILGGASMNSNIGWKDGAIHHI